MLCLCAATLFLLGGCMTVGPDYIPVTPQSPDTWQTKLQEGLTEESISADLVNWWQLLQDPHLCALEERAVAGNLDLQAAQARIREARALRGISSAEYFPTLDSRATAAKSHSSADSSTGLTRELYSAQFDARWELDIFGGVRRSVEAAQATLEATEAALYDLQVTLLAEVALNYVDLRTYQARLEVSRENIVALQELYALNISRFQAGMIDELAVQESLQLLESHRALVPTLESGLNAAKNRLALLLGSHPGSLHAELAAKLPLPSLPISVAVGIPADTLRRRPDIRRAERNLAAQTAQIGAATADLYPRFYLFGTIGLESLTAGDLFRGASKTWGFGPGVSWNLFDAGAIRRNIAVQNARQEQLLLRYEQTVLYALEEVENALIAYAKEQLRREHIAKATLAATRAEELARDQYQAGLINFYNVLDAQRSLLTLRDEQARSDGVVFANLVRIYKALGGGWAPIPTSTKGDIPL
ncbi:MAG: efflux transporter outer membrane subunit [Desulfuromonadales bacterium]|nr:efflux transporter outer membrane subunit [Desulfuromonadales bacterium]